MVQKIWRLFESERCFEELDLELLDRSINGLEITAKQLVVCNNNKRWGMLLLPVAAIATLVAALVIILPLPNTTPAANTEDVYYAEFRPSPKEILASGIQLVNQTDAEMVAIVSNGYSENPFYVIFPEEDMLEEDEWLHEYIPPVEIDISLEVAYPVTKLEIRPEVHTDVRTYVQPYAEPGGSSDSISKVEVPVFTQTSGRVSYNQIKGSVQEGKAFGKLTIPRLNLNNHTVRYGAQAEIDIGLCQYMYWDLPGSSGVSLLSAHNYNPNWQIGRLVIGDYIYYETPYGQYTYQVYRAHVNNEGRNLYWLQDSYYTANKTDLALITCYPFDYVNNVYSDGADGRRYVVFCKLISGPELTDIPKTRMNTSTTFEELELYHKSKASEEK